MAGTLNNALAEQIRARWAEWSVSPDVTGQYTRPVLERLLLRTWLRDGEVFSQMVAGKMPGLEPVAGVPFWLEAMEPDYVPMEQTDSTNNLIQGSILTTGKGQKVTSSVNLAGICHRYGGHQAYRCRKYAAS